MSYLFIMQDPYTLDFTGVIEATPDEQEIIEKKNKGKYERILTKCSIKIIAKYDNVLDYFLEQY